MTDSMTGEKRAIADTQVVPVGEADRHDDGLDALQIAIAVPRRRRGRPGSARTPSTASVRRAGPESG